MLVVAGEISLGGAGAAGTASVRKTPTKAKPGPKYPETPPRLVISIGAYGSEKPSGPDGGFPPPTITVPDAWNWNFTSPGIIEIWIGSVPAPSPPGAWGVDNPAENMFASPGTLTVVVTTADAWNGNDKQITETILRMFARFINGFSFRAAFYQTGFIKSRRKACEKYPVSDGGKRSAAVSPRPAAAWPSTNSRAIWQRDLIGARCGWSATHSPLSPAVNRIFIKTFIR